MGLEGNFDIVPRMALDTTERLNSDGCHWWHIAPARIFIRIPMPAHSTSSFPLADKRCENASFTISKSPYWMVRLCKMTRDVENAELRRDIARAGLAEADAAFDKALSALHGYYSRLPYQIPVTDDALEKVRRFSTAWLGRPKPDPDAKDRRPGSCTM